MHNSSKFSVILMHDDGRMMRLRISNFFFRIILIALILAPILGILGFCVGFEGWRTTQGWQVEKQRLQEREKGFLARLEKMSQLEAKLQQKEKELTTLTSKLNESKSKKMSVESAPPPPEPTAPIKQISEQDTVVDLGKIRVENLQVHFPDSRRIRVTADLYNAMTDGRQLVGRSVFKIVTSNGHEFAIIDDEDAAFRISRFKSVVATSPLSVSSEELQNATVFIEITVNGELVYRNHFPIDQS